MPIKGSKTSNPVQLVHNSASEKDSRPGWLRIATPVRG